MQILLRTAAYVLATFPLAVVWHVVLFGDQYRAFGYVEGEPNFVLGFVTILLQGVLLSALYPRVTVGGTGVSRGLRFALLLGFFFWTSHVLAFAAKQNVAHVVHFVGMESVYLALQFGIYGVLVGLIHRRTLATPT